MDHWFRGKRRRFGRFAERSEAEAQAKAVRAYVLAKGQLPPAGWLGIRGGLAKGRGPGPKVKGQGSEVNPSGSDSKKHLTPLQAAWH